MMIHTQTQIHPHTNSHPDTEIIFWIVRLDSINDVYLIAHHSAWPDWSQVPPGESLGAIFHSNYQIMIKCNACNYHSAVYYLFSELLHNVLRLIIVIVNTFLNNKDQHWRKHACHHYFLIIFTLLHNCKMVKSSGEQSVIVRLGQG